MPTSVANLKVKDSSHELIIKANDITIDGTSLITKVDGKANDSDVVKLTGNQTVAGTKTFKDGMFTKNIIPKGYITLGTSTNTWGHMIQFQDTAGKRISRIQPMAIDTTKNRMGMWVNNADDTVEYGIEIWSDGTTIAPTPATSDNSTKIATTAFVKNQGYIGSANLATCHVVVETYVNGSSWYRVYDDGWVEQGGQNNTVGTGTVVTITLLKEFQDTSYFATRTALLGTSAGGNASYLSGILNRTVSSFQYRIDQTAYTTGAIWYACGYGA